MISRFGSLRMAVLVLLLVFKDFTTLVIVVFKFQRAIRETIV